MGWGGANPNDQPTKTNQNQLTKTNPPKPTNPPEATSQGEKGRRQTELGPNTIDNGAAARVGGGEEGGPEKSVANRTGPQHLGRRRRCPKGGMGRRGERVETKS